MMRIVRGTRLWILAAVLFAGGVAGRAYVESTGDAANAYGVAVEWQMDLFGTGLLCLLAWIILQARGDEQRVWGSLLWLVLLFCSGVAILSSIPK